MTTPETPKRSNQEELARIYELLERAEKHREAKAFGIKRLMMVNPRQPTEADLLGILREAF